MSSQPVIDPIVGALILGRYRVVARLASGGMGVVYLARSEGAAGFAKPVVVKRILPEHINNADVARLFVREAKILSNLQHPNIVGVTDFGEEDGAYIMVLDYVRAYHLGVWLLYRVDRREKMPAALAIHVMIKVLDALEYAHTLTLPDGTKLDIVHSDISPSNILVDTDGQVKLLDFGIARMKGEVTKSTDTKSIRGKLAYLPLEALDGTPPRVATDVYACGVTLYELLSGVNPFSMDDDVITVARVVSHIPPPISTIRPEIPPALDAILARAMSKSAGDRYTSAKEFANVLRRIAPLSDADASQSLATIAKHDFAEIPKDPSLGALSLAELENAWRNVEPRAVIRPSNAAFAPTDMQPQRPKARSLTAVIVLLVLLVVGVIAGILVFVLHRPDGDDDAKVILVEHTASAVPVTALSTSAAPTTDLPRDASAPKPPPPPKPSDPLGAAFAKNQPAIEACFRDSPGTGDELSVRFSIDTSGVVQKAELIPADLANGPLGQCLLAVAKRTQFPPQNAPATFRIPLKTRRSQ